MKSTNSSSQNVPHPGHPAYRTSGRDYANPVDYEPPYPSMKRLAEGLALRYDANPTVMVSLKHPKPVDWQFAL